MNQSSMVAGIVILIIVVIAVVYLALPSLGVYSNITTTIVQNATTASTTTPPPTNVTTFAINVNYNSQVGNYLTNASGWSLYIYTVDIQNSGQSACYGSCATIWPPFYAANVTAPTEVNASAFGTITRTDGTKQLTYMGWPVYTYAGDSKAGDINGQGVANTWYVITVPTLTTITKKS